MDFWVLQLCFQSVETDPKLDSEGVSVCVGIYGAFKGCACRRGDDHIHIDIYICIYIYISSPKKTWIHSPEHSQTTLVNMRLGDDLRALGSQNLVESRVNAISQHLPNYRLRHPTYHLTEPISPLIDVRWEALKMLMLRWTMELSAAHSISPLLKVSKAAVQVPNI